MSVPHAVASINDLQSLPDGIEFPVVLKTAEPGIDHKSGVGGVKLAVLLTQRLSFLNVSLREIDADHLESSFGEFDAETSGAAALVEDPISGREPKGLGEEITGAG